jgi:hypothetical protein
MSIEVKVTRSTPSVYHTLLESCTKYMCGAIQCNIIRLIVIVSKASS